MVCPLPPQDRDNSPSSCAGLFIASHIGFDWPGVWVHLDIAAPVHAVSPGPPPHRGCLPARQGASSAGPPPSASPSASSSLGTEWLRCAAPPQPAHPRRRPRVQGLTLPHSLALSVRWGSRGGLWEKAGRTRSPWSGAPPGRGGLAEQGWVWPHRQRVPTGPLPAGRARHRLRRGPPAGALRASLRGPSAEPGVPAGL